jgi:type II secretory pathway component PulF
MPPKRTAKTDLADLALLCRPIARALEAGETITAAFDALAKHPPGKTKPLVDAVRHRLRAGGRMSEELIDRGLPSYVSATVRRGEVAAALGPALIALADRLDLERHLPASRDADLRAYALAFGRLSMVLGVGVPFPEAAEAAAESVAPCAAADALMKAKRAVVRGESLVDALGEAAAGLPPMTIEMIRDGENDRRLPQALAVVADYLLDEAGQPAKRARKEKAHA